MNFIEGYICFGLITLFLFFNFGCFQDNSYDISEVEAFYNKFSTVQELMTELKTFEYRWEPNDLNYYFDSAPEPGLTISRRWANCNGFARLVSEFTKIKGTAYSLKTVLMTKNTVGVVTRWHYINIINTADGLYEQSNNQIRKIDNEGQAEILWRSMGYETYEVVDTWIK